MTLGRFNLDTLGIGGGVVWLAWVLQGAGVFGLTVRCVITSVAIASAIMAAVKEKGASVDL